MTLPKHRPMTDIIRGFKFQSQRDDCWSVCIHNVLEELADRLDEPVFRQSEARLNKAMGYGSGMGALGIRLDRVRPNVNRLIEASGYGLVEQAGVGFDGLVVNIKSEELSYPVAGLSSQYLSDKPRGARLRIEGDLAEAVDHTCIVLAADSSNVTIFDPLERFSGSGKGSDGIISLSTPSFLSYWSRASVEREWLMYAAPLAGLRTRTLLDFAGENDAT